MANHGASFIATAAAILAAALLLLAAPSARAQDGAEPPGVAGETPRAATGGAQTLEDIMARQRGEAVDGDFRRREPGSFDPQATIRGQLGPRGTDSVADIYGQFRADTGNVTVSTGRPVDTVVIQDGGMRWLEWRKGPVVRYGLYGIAATVVLLALFLLLRGRVRIEAGRSGVLIERFDGIERFGHWLLAGSFILLAVTGLAQLLGRTYLIPLLGRESFAAIAAPGKWLHNNVAWAFMIALVLVVVLWVARNLPRLADLKWLLMAGGLFSRGKHPPAYKFNAGQKILYWLVILLGASISLSGLSLLFPFELPLFAKTFTILNDIAAALGIEARLPTDLAPQEEMQFAQIWHVIVAFAMIVLILGHIYIGTIGMEGAFDAMGTGKVDLNWAREHHSLWVEEEIAAGHHPDNAAQPGPAG